MMNLTAAIGMLDSTIVLRSAAPFMLSACHASDLHQQLPWLDLYCFTACLASA